MDLRDLFMFAHLKWMQPGEKRYSDCVAFIFMSLILVLGPVEKKKSRQYKIFPIWEIQMNESDSEVTSISSTSTDPNQHHFSITHMASSQQLPTIYNISCCHFDIKTHFIKSAKKALRVYL